MAFGVRARLTGLKDVLDRLAHLRKQTTRSKIARRALQMASTPILKTAKRLAPKETGLLRKSIGRRLKTYRRTGTVFVMIGPRYGFKQLVTLASGKQHLRNPIKYAHLVELGTANAPPHPFLRPAWDAHKAQAEATIRRIVLEEITAEAAKGGGRRSA
jgi:HK97 gp10 family phage protein